jgi:aminopeptidase YwaD
MDNEKQNMLERAGDVAQVMADLGAICDTGGRFAGSESEARAREYMASRLEEITGSAPDRIAIEDTGWTRGEASIERVSDGTVFPCVSLVRSPETTEGGLVADLIDIGRGTEADFDAHADAIAGNIVMVRHEYMFAAETTHRRRKYEWAIDRGAAGFLIASHLSGDLPVTGSSGATPERGIPAAGISAETAAELTKDVARQIKIRIAADTGPRRTENLIYDIPGRSGDWVVLSAHIDGHHMSESAMDNGTGLAAVLNALRAVIPCADKFERGLRIGFFTVEEWALAGSAAYVDAMSDAERDAIKLNINLDSVAGDPDITALTSGFEKAEGWMIGQAAETGYKLGAHRPLMRNSDHYNFARHGIPAARLVAGFDNPRSNLTYVLTPADNRDKIVPADLARATQLTAGLVLAACTAEMLDLR